jgi:hypothetical protein
MLYAPIPSLIISRRSPQQSRTGIVFSVVLLVAIAAAGAWYYFYGPCGINRLQASSKAISSLLTRFSDELQVANSTPRMSLAGPVSNLQQIKRETDDLVVPACLDMAKGYAVGSMVDGINGFIAFMGQEDNSVVTSHLNSATSQAQYFQDELVRVQACAPFCQ